MDVKDAMMFGGSLGDLGPTERGYAVNLEMTPDPAQPANLRVNMASPEPAQGTVHGWGGSRKLTVHTRKRRRSPSASLRCDSLAKEYKVVAIREYPLPADMKLCDNPDAATSLWQEQISAHPYFNPECECFVVILLNARRRVKGHQLVSVGTLDSIVVHPREVFRTAVLVSAASVVVMHNHPSGDPTPSEADVKTTRDLIRAGQVLKIEVVDHIIVGRGQRASLREMGLFYV